MAKPIEKDGKLYRMRRGKLVEIPPGWVGKVTSRQTINKRPSKQLHKLRKLTKYGDSPRARKTRKRERENGQVDSSEAGPIKSSLDNP